MIILRKAYAEISSFDYHLETSFLRGILYEDTISLNMVFLLNEMDFVSKLNWKSVL